MSLTIKEKELTAVGASLAAGCKSCTDYHFKKVRGAGASDEEIKKAMTDAIAVRDEARKIMEWHGLKLLGLMFRRAEDEEDDAIETNRMTELVSVAAAFVVNCTSSLEKHLAAARDVGVTDDEIAAVVDLARFIKGKADSLCCKLI
jgi:AhpD family alkylhydroperoxidase